MVHGRAFPDAPVASEDVFRYAGVFESLAKRSALRWICHTYGGLDLVFFDADAGSFLHEWAAVEKYCRPSFIVLHCVNLPDHSGWLRAHLLNFPEWVEIARGVGVQDGSSRQGHHPLELLYMVHRWVVLWRARLWTKHKIPRQPSAEQRSDAESFVPRAETGIDLSGLDLGKVSSDKIGEVLIVFP